MTTFGAYVRAIIDQGGDEARRDGSAMIDARVSTGVNPGGASVQGSACQVTHHLGRGSQPGR